MRNPNTSALIEAARRGDAPTVGALLLRSEVRARTGNALALTQAAMNGHVECVKLLLPFSNPKQHAARALERAVEGRHAKCVEVLLQTNHTPDPNVVERCVHVCLKNNDAACARVLVAHCGTFVGDTWTLDDTVRWNHAQALAAVATSMAAHSVTHVARQAIASNQVTCLLAVVPRLQGEVFFEYNSVLLQVAYEKSQGQGSEIVDILYPLCDPQRALDGLRKKFQTSAMWVDLEERIAHTQAKTIAAQLPQNTATRRMKI